MTSLSRRSAALIGGAALVSSALPAIAAGAAKNKVVFQVSDPEPAKWNLALNNVRNLQTELPDDESDIEVVVYGPGIGMLKADAIIANRVDDAVASGVKVVACEITMKAQKLTRDDMNQKIDYVPAGVVELMHRQQQGYAYIRP